ncbi:B3 domain-containing protein At5g60142-like [Argentina anserina]|uniref:B3 domain-containing protein At5g60142-like n=1 Tax=Argentina anserina TaxID=57926 RepID=UPI002176343F|nr:B3 domain-containing protein At5g60142-like [Potentilla anserina]
MARRRDPSFFKILLGDHFCHKLKIPRAFLKHFDGNVPEQFRLCTPAGTWFVDVEKLNHKYYFQNGWNKFVHENGLKVKVILVFRYTGNSELSVDIYGKNACKKLYGMATRKESDCSRLKDVDYPMEDGDEDDNPSIEILDDDPSVEILDDVPQCRASIGHYSQLPSPLPHIDVLLDNEDNSYDERESYTNAEEGDEDNYESEEEDEDENLSAEESETAADVDYGDEKSEGDNEDEDEDHKDDDDVSIEILSEKLSCSKTRGKSPLGSHLRKSKITCSNSEVRSNDKDVGGSFRTVSILKQREQLDMEVRKLSALQRARYFESKSAKPCVVLPMRASYAQGYYLSFPRDFAKRHFKKKPNHAIFELMVYLTMSSSIIPITKLMKPELGLAGLHLRESII